MFRSVGRVFCSRPTRIAADAPAERIAVRHSETPVLPAHADATAQGAHAEKIALRLPVASSTILPAADASAKGAQRKQTTEKQSVSHRPKSTAVKRKRRPPCLARLFRRKSPCARGSRCRGRTHVRVATVYIGLLRYR